jgi:hypothetical protein
MTTLDDLDLFAPTTADPVPTPRKHRHDWEPRWVGIGTDEAHIVYRCRRCPAIRDEQLARRGKQSRNYGNRAELAVARRYGGEKIGHAGGPVDVRGKDFNVQVKTHRRLPPAEWRKAFGGMSANLERVPRLLLRFLPGPGLPPDDYIVIRGDDWLRWFGRDE